MGFTFGKNLPVTIFGASHAECVGISISGIKAGIKIDFAYIENELKKRRAHASFYNERKEDDEYEVLSGIFNGYTTGGPLTVIFPNKDVKEDDEFILRGSHADYASYVKYGKTGDFRGGGFSSGRMTVPLVFIGAVAKKILEGAGICVVSHIKSIKDLQDSDFPAGNLEDAVDKLKNSDFPLLDSGLKKEFESMIQNAHDEGDSLGGTVETLVYHLPAGIGEPFFTSIESHLASLLFSVPGIKGVEFGDGFALSRKKGSEVLDEFYFTDKIRTKTNHNGGINGGISNGEPVIVRFAFKPTPSITGIAQHTVDIANNENIYRKLKGRFDPTIVVKGCHTATNLVAYGILDLYLSQFGWNGLK